MTALSAAAPVAPEAGACRILHLEDSPIDAELVAALGAPERTYETEGRKFLTFEERRSQNVAGPYYPYGFYGRYGPYFSPPGYIVRTCEITFAVRGGRVESFTYRGDGCR